MSKTSYSLLILSLLSLSGCARLSLPPLSLFPGVYKIDIQQGNVITQEMIDQLRPGMTRRQVRFVLGTPLITDTFHPDRWDYVYSLQPGGNERTQERISLYFDGDSLTRFEGDFRPSETAQN